MTVAELIESLQRLEPSMSVCVVTNSPHGRNLYVVRNPFVLQVARYNGDLMLWESIPSDVDEHPLPIDRESCFVVFHQGLEL